MPADPPPGSVAMVDEEVGEQRSNKATELEALNVGQMRKEPTMPRLQAWRIWAARRRSQCYHRHLRKGVKGFRAEDQCGPRKLASTSWFPRRCLISRCRSINASRTALQSTPSLPKPTLLLVSLCSRLQAPARRSFPLRLAPSLLPRAKDRC